MMNEDPNQVRHETVCEVRVRKHFANRSFFFKEMQRMRLGHRSETSERRTAADRAG